MLRDNKWVYNRTSKEETETLSRKAGISPLLARVCLARGFKEADEVINFLNPDIKYLCDPYLMKDMDWAVERITKALDKKDRVVIYGDYDVDGVTATSILYRFFRLIGINAEYYIPERLENGYGISIQAIDEIYGKGVDLVVTVDCGISAAACVEYAKGIGIDFVVTDHHECSDSIPAGVPCVNPCRHDCNYPHRDLSGAGVAFKLVQALCIRLGLGDKYLDYLPLAAVGTIADLVPLHGENRIIAHEGLKRMAISGNPGINALIEVCNIAPETLTAYHIGYMFGPRINASGRLGSAEKAVRLFITDDFSEALDIAKQLDSENQQRRRIETQILEEAAAQVEKENLDKNRVLVVSGEGWHQGVIGIVASRLTEIYYRPSFVISSAGNVARGSGRSIRGIDLYYLLSKCSGLLTQYGGHELAAGLSMNTFDIKGFSKMINEYAMDIDEEVFSPRIHIDGVVQADEIDIDAVRELEKLSPFGVGNNPPLFVMENVSVRSARAVGDGKHLKLDLSADGRNFSAIGFNFSDILESLTMCETVRVAFRPEINTWNGMDSVQLNIKDMKPERLKHEKHTFYYTLEKCIPADISAKKDAEIKMKEVEEKEIPGIIFERVNTGKHCFIFVNSLASLKRLQETLNKSEQNIKKDYEIWYTGIGNGYAKKTCIIVNPIIGELDEELIDSAVFYGEWLDLQYRDALIHRLEGKNIYICPVKCANTEYSSLTPDRTDMAAVYKYINYLIERGIRKDLFSMSDDIKCCFGVDMNYFKLKKCLDVFEELSLLTRKPVGWFEMAFALRTNNGKKASLESSMVLRRLQRLKQRQD